MVWVIADKEWNTAYDAVGRVITCSRYKDSSSSPFLEFGIAGELSGYHVHVKTKAGHRSRSFDTRVNSPITGAVATSWAGTRATAVVPSRRRSTT
jgi:hypothetical protein